MPRLPGRFVFGTSSGELWVIDGDGSGRRRISASPAGHLDFDPSWSPDGRRIVFRSDESVIPDPNGIGLDEIVVMDSDGRGRHRINPPTGGLFPAWSPKGTLIAFSGIVHPGDPMDHIMTMRSDGSDVTRVSGRGGEAASWSPDGRWIAFDSHPLGSGEWDIWKVRADGSGERRLTTSTGTDNVGPWSADGRRILFSSLRAGNREMFVMDADGRDQRRLTYRLATGESPDAWLPDGRIVFSSSYEGGPARWFVMNADGSGVRALPQLTGAGDPLDWTPSK